ncbi:MAG TPA: CoA transferase [Tepidiformaceae bacterium]|nr:CoA transferase [Tepidiformaceae bacterium]
METASRPAGRPYLPLKGIRVLAFELAYSLPAGTRTLAELGAEVVRVVGPGRDSFYIGVVDGVYFSKTCVGVNLKSPEGLAVAKELVRHADIVCSNFVGGVMERLGLGYDVLTSINPAVIALQLSGFGSPGPWSSYPAFGPSTEAAGGMNRLIGEDPEPPIRIGSGVFSDQLGGRFTALALLAALEERQRTGRGRFIDLSMMEAISLLVGNTVADAAFGVEPDRLGNRDRDFAPQGIYRCKGEDDWIGITVKSDRAWRALCREMGEAAPRGRGLGTAEGRRANWQAIDAAIEAWTACFDKDELAARLQRRGIAAHGVVKSRDPLFDEHLAERGLFKTVVHNRPILGYAAHPHPSTPWFADGHARTELTDIRFHGYDNTEVLGSWLGYEPERVADLEASGALLRLVNVEVEDRRTNYRDADFAEQQGLPLTAERPAPAPVRALRRRPVTVRTRPLRVLEASNGPSGGFAGMLLALLGHGVTRIAPGCEAHPHGNSDRRTTALSETERAFLDRGKQLRSLDPHSAAGQAELLHLAREFDVLIEDFGPGGLRVHGIPWRALRAANPDLVVASISPFGQTGPKRQWSASELVLQASSGPLHSTGWKGERPFKAGGYSAHHIAGVNTAGAVLAAVYGIAAGLAGGVRLDVSMQECYLHHWSRHIGEWSYSGTKMHRELKGFGHQGFRHTAMAADGWLYLLALYASWDEIALFLGLEEFITDDWQSAEYRAEHWRELDPVYHQRLAQKGRYEWFAEASEAGYTWAPVHSASDQFANPQFAARGFLKPTSILGRDVPLPGLPFTWQPFEPAEAGRAR